MDQLLTLWIDSKTKTKTRIAAATQGISMSEWIRRAIDERLRLFDTGEAQSVDGGVTDPSSGQL
jgi:hypothetical protein